METSFFHVEINLKQFDERFGTLLPAHRAYVNALLMKGQIQSYSVAEDRSKLWIVLNCHELDVENLINKMPLHIYFEDYNITPLLFHNNHEQMMPAISLN